MLTLISALKSRTKPQTSNAAKTLAKVTRREIEALFSEELSC